MEFILAQLSMLMWLSLISFILAEFPVQQLKILISGGTGSAVFSFFFFFLFRSKEATAILHVFWVYAKRFLQQHSFGAAMANIIKCPANTLPPLRARTNKHTYKKKKKKTPLPFSPSSLILSPSFSSWLSLSGSARGGKRAHWSAKVSSHFTGRVCAALLSLNGNCSFHLAALPVADYWEAPAREGQKEGGSAGVRAPVRAWQAADKSSSCCSCMHLPLLLELCLSLSLSSTHSYGHTHSFFLRTCEALIITLALWWVSPLFLRQG